jgi:hypothetical protein
MKEKEKESEKETASDHGDDDAAIYSHVGRRSSPGMPAVSIRVETVGNVRSSGAPLPARPAVTTSRPPTLAEMAAVRARMRTERPAVEVQVEDVPDSQIPATKKFPPPIHPPPAPAPATEKSVPPPAPVAAAAAAEKSSASERPPSSERARPQRSVRPPAPDPFAANPAESQSIAQTFDRLLGSELDSRFGEIRRSSEKPPMPGSLPPGQASLEEVRELFEHLAANHVGPVREFVIDLRWGEASCEWIPVCASAVESLSRAAQKLSMTELERALAAFAAATEAAAGEPSKVVDGPVRDQILAAYDVLARILPKAFALDMDRAARESRILQSLLLQIPDVHRVTVERLHAAGLNSIAMLADARPHEIAETTGIGRKLAERIVETFSSYRDERQAHPTTAAHGRERARLDELLNELEAHHAGYEHAAEAWSSEATAAKARHRRERQRTLMAISVILARMGEIALLQRLEKLPFDRKLEGLRKYIQNAAPESASPTISL